MIAPQLEVDGRTTTRKLDNLISQTEYGLAVTPVYDEGPGQPMLGEAVTGKNGNLHSCNAIVVTSLEIIDITLLFSPAPL